MNPVLPEQVTPQTVNTRINVLIAQISNFYKLTLRNLDSTNQASVAIWANAS